MPNVLRLVQESIVNCGFDLHRRSEDRSVLEKEIFPYFKDSKEFSSILFVGCRWYTKGYNKIFEQKNYWTMDVDSRQSRFGTKQHVVDSMQNIIHHFAENYFDLIICNGVVGYGLNEKTDIDNAFQGAFRALRRQGLFVLGWNDIEGYDLHIYYESQSLRLFSPYVFPPFGVSEYATKTVNRHTFSFYTK